MLHVDGKLTDFVDRSFGSDELRRNSRSLHDRMEWISDIRMNVPDAAECPCRKVECDLLSFLQSVVTMNHQLTMHFSRELPTVGRPFFFRSPRHFAGLFHRHV